MSIFSRRRRRLLPDILDRDKDSYVWIDRAAKRIDWSDLTDGENVCSFHIKDDIKTSEEAFRRGVSLMGAVRSVLGLPKTVSVTFTKEESYTNGKMIAVATEHFKDAELGQLTKIDVLIGLFIHEGYHILYTDIEGRAKEIMEFEGVKDLFASISNVIEDERIERKGSTDFPGFTGYIGKTKKYLLRELFLRSLKKMVDAEKDEKEKEAASVVTRLFSIFHAIVRFPDNVLDEDLRDYRPFINDVMSLLKDNYPKTDFEVSRTSRAVYDLMFKYATDEMKQVLEEQKKAALSEKEMEGLSKMLEKMFNSLGKAMREALCDGFEKAKILPKEVKALEESGKMVTIPGTALKEMLEGIEMEIPDTELPEKYEYGTTPKTKFLRANEDRVTYTQSKAVIGPQYKILSTLLQRDHRDLKLVAKGSKSGYLDANKLVEASLGVETIYETYSFMRTRRIDVAVLADESGSMSSGYVPGLRRYEAAMQSCIMLQEALKNVRDCQLFIYGFTSEEGGVSRTNQIRVYKEPGFFKKYALGSLQARCQNRDGECIYETALRVRKFTNNPCILFVISDGAPCASDYSGYSHTKKMVEKVEKMGFVVIQIAISNGVESDKMFKHWVKFTNAASLPKEIGNTVKKVLRKLRIVDVTY